MSQGPEPALPDGFRQTNSGLIVPEDVSREREVWTDQERMIFQKAVDLATRKGLLMVFTCPHARCAQHAQVRLLATPGGQELVCEHKRRLLEAPLVENRRLVTAIDRRRTRAEKRLAVEQRRATPRCAGRQSTNNRGC